MNMSVKHVLLVMHYLPVNVGSQWPDSIKLRNDEQFWHIMRTLKKARVIICGHLYLGQYLVVCGVELFCTEASDPQLKKAQDPVTLEDNPALIPSA
jgi:hypothetical protein